MLSLDPSCHILFLSCMSWDEDIPVSPLPAARNMEKNKLWTDLCECVTKNKSFSRRRILSGILSQWWEKREATHRLPYTEAYSCEGQLSKILTKKIKWILFFHSSPFYDPYLNLDDWRVVYCSGLWVQIIHLKCSITKSWLSWVVIITKLLYKHCILFIVNI